MLEELSKRDKEWRNLAFVICRDKQLADDLTQEMYLKFYRNPKEKIDDSCIFFTLTNLFRDYLRKNKRKNECDFDDSIKLNIDDDTILEKRKYMSEILDKLSFVDREILLLTSEYSLRDCAKLMNDLPFNEVSYQWFHHRRKKGLEKLKIIINEGI